MERVGEKEAIREAERSLEKERGRERKRKKEGGSEGEGEERDRARETENERGGRRIRAQMNIPKKQTIFWGFKITADGDCSHGILDTCSLEEKL